MRVLHHQILLPGNHLEKWFRVNNYVAPQWILFIFGTLMKFLKRKVSFINEDATTTNMATRAAILKNGFWTITNEPLTGFCLYLVH